MGIRRKLGPPAYLLQHQSSVTPYDPDSQLDPRLLSIRDRAREVFISAKKNLSYRISPHGFSTYYLLQELRRYPDEESDFYLKAGTIWREIHEELIPSEEE